MLVRLRRLLSIKRHIIPSEALEEGTFPILSRLDPPVLGFRMNQTAGLSSSSNPKRQRVDHQDLPPIYIVGAARTPLGSFQGGLSHLSATELGAIAIRAAVERAGVNPSTVDEVLMGNVCGANLGQAPARQASLKAGLPLSADCTTINKVCSSGMKAVALGAQSIALGFAKVVIAGGMESMSNIPHYAPALRRGSRLGDATLVDGLLKDGLTDAIHNIHMGVCAEMCAENHGITREAQDAHAEKSVARAKAATADGTSAWEIVPVERPSSSTPSPSSTPSSSSQGAAPSGINKGTNGGTSSSFVSEDEAMKKMDGEKLRRLPPYFKKDGGTVTAGNASPLTDGAAALVLASGNTVRDFKLPVLARVLAFADAAQDPREFPTTPALAVKLALYRAGLEVSDVDYWEINEAFSVVDLVNQKLLGLDPEKVNVFGGAVAIGHPIGGSGARLVVTLLNVLRARGGKIGVAAICNGGGGATALVIERMDSAE